MTETLTALTRLLVLVFLVSSMSGIGLGLTLSQIIAPLRNVKLIVLAVIMISCRRSRGWWVTGKKRIRATI